MKLLLLTGVTRFLTQLKTILAWFFFGFSTYSIELPDGFPNQSEIQAESWIYATMEPCSIRTSGGPSCSNAILKSGIKQVYIVCLLPFFSHSRHIFHREHATEVIFYLNNRASKNHRIS